MARERSLNMISERVVMPSRQGVLKSTSTESAVGCLDCDCWSTRVFLHGRYMYPFELKCHQDTSEWPPRLRWQQIKEGNDFEHSRQWAPRGADLTLECRNG